MFAEMTQDHSHDLANIASATQLDRTTVANMYQVITDLTLQLTQANAKLSEAQSSVATLTLRLSQTWTRANLPPDRPPPGTINMELMEKDGYCWTHGYKIKRGHKSSTCQIQRQGHNTEVTRSNTIGGTTRNKGWEQ